MIHHCHATGCAVPVKPELLMCLKHWRMVPRAIQVLVWKHYRNGQCDDMNPSEEWHRAADAAIGYVALMEEKPITGSQRIALAKAGVIPSVVSVVAQVEARKDSIQLMMPGIVNPAARLKKP